MSYYKGTKPCPGCEKTPDESPRSKADEVCWDCGKLLRLGRGVRENSAGFSVIKLAKYSMQGIYVSEVNGKTSDSPRRRDGFAYVSDTSNRQGSSGQLLEAVLALVKTLDEGAKESYEFKINMVESFPEQYSLRTPTALALVELLDVIRLYGDRREAEGYERGQQLLIGLADGRLSIQVFNDRSTKQF